MKRMLKSLLLVGAAFTGSSALSQDLLETSFRDPPTEARPRVWWHWLNGAISQEGIKRDLDWMQQAGIGGVQIFYGAMPNNDGIVTPPVRYMSPEWKAAIRAAAQHAAAKGMEVTVSTSAGWSETGATFVAPSDAMKKFVWTETDVEGGRRFQGVLPRPSDVPGPIGAVDFGKNTLLTGQIGPQPPKFYADSRVFAYRVPAGEKRLPLPKVTTAQGEVAAPGLFDGQPFKVIEIDRPAKNKPTWVRFDYPSAVTIRSLTIVLAGKKPEIAVSTQLPAQLETSDDGVTFSKAVDLTAGAFTQNTTSFAPVTSRYFRVVLNEQPFTMPDLNMAPGALFMPGLPAGETSPKLAISEMALMAEPRVNRFEEKAGFASVPDYYAVPTSDTAQKLVIKKADIVDLTGRMQPDGTLDWTPASGRWRVVRLGYSLTGHMNGPTSPEATGLEVDKLSAPRVRAYMNRYLDDYRDIVGAKGLQGTVNDSIEAGHQNWTDDILAQFQKRRGYDLAPWLPVLTGRIVGSAAQSDAVLYDFRRTLADLMAEAHYGTVADVNKQRGLITYGEALEVGDRFSLGDDLAMRSHADVPMGAMWMFRKDKDPDPAYVADLKGAASAAHLYGRKHVGAESMSSIFQYWSLGPRDLKHVADTELALGVNLFSIHSSVHQPFTDKVPGVTLWMFGQQFNRNESWGGQARPWIDYLARTSWMLSQGRYAADVAYFYGEEAPIVTLASQKTLKDLPVRYGYDFVNSDALQSVLSVKDGALTSASGMRYRLLQLGGSSQRMTLPTLRRIADLATAGATILGDKPVASPSEADDPKAFKALADRLWAGGTETRVGAGRVLSGLSSEAALARIGVVPDQEILAQANSSVRFLHRVLDDGDVWFVANSKGDAFAADVAFRVTGREPELWDADTGTSRPLSYRIEQGRTIVPLKLDGSGSALVVFRKATSVPSRTVAPRAERTIATADGDWKVTFQQGRGAPAGTVGMPTGSWPQNKDPRVRYFSGVATYAKTIDIPRSAAGTRTLLALGEVDDLAEVWVNGRHVRTVWRAPYRVDITEAVKPGRNTIEVKVANRWVNRLVGDAQPGAKKVTWTATPTYSPDAPLVPSGLIGPVSLIEARGE